MDPVWLVGNIALVCTIISNFAGSKVCWEFIKSKSTGSVPSLPFIAGVTCISLWLQYSLLIMDPVLMTVNSIAVFLQFCYTLCYYFYTSRRDIMHQQILLVGTVLASASTYAWYLASSHEAATNLIGTLACCGSIFSCAAPLATVKQVFQTRSTKSLPFPLIMGSFVVTSLWFLYGLLVRDNYIQVPNFIGALLSGFQLYLFVMFS